MLSIFYAVNEATMNLSPTVMMTMSLRVQVLSRSVVITGANLINLKNTANHRVLMAPHLRIVSKNRDTMTINLPWPQRRTSVTQKHEFTIEKGIDNTAKFTMLSLWKQFETIVHPKIHVMELKKNQAMILWVFKRVFECGDMAFDK